MPLQYQRGQPRYSHTGGAAFFLSVLTASTKDGTGAVVMTAANPKLFPFRLLLAIRDEQGWTGYRQPARKRLHRLPGIRHLAHPRAPEPADLGGSS